MDAKIAQALSANGSADCTALVALISDATAAIEMAQCVVDAETPRIHDLSNDSPNEFVALIDSSQLHISRLSAALPQLQQRIATLDAAAALIRWNAAADQLQAQSNELWSELTETYASSVTRLIDIWNRVDRNTAAIHAAHRQRPPGVQRELIGADHPALRANLRLPHWDAPDRIAFPRDEAQAFQLAMSDMMVAHAKALDAKMALTSGPGWFEGQRLAAEQIRAESDEREQEMREKAAADREAYHRALLELERRKVTG